MPSQLVKKQLFKYKIVLCLIFCATVQYKKDVAAQPSSAKCPGESCCHLHSTDIPFWDALDMVGSASVSITAAVMELDEGEEEDEDVAALSLSFFFKRFLLRSMEATSDFNDR